MLALTADGCATLALVDIRSASRVSLLAFLWALTIASAGVLVTSILVIAGFSLFIASAADGSKPALLLSLLATALSVVAGLLTIRGTMGWLVRARQARTSISTLLGFCLLVGPLGLVAWKVAVAAGSSAAALFVAAAGMIIVAWAVLGRR